MQLMQTKRFDSRIFLAFPVMANQKNIMVVTHLGTQSRTKSSVFLTLFKRGGEGVKKAKKGWLTFVHSPLCLLLTRIEIPNHLSNR